MYGMWDDPQRLGKRKFCRMSEQREAGGLAVDAAGECRTSAAGVDALFVALAVGRSASARVTTYAPGMASCACGNGAASTS